LTAKTQTIVAVSLVIWTAGTAAAKPQENKSSSKLEEVTVTSTRIPRRIADEPARVEVIGREELDEKVAMSPGNVAMLLNESSGLHVQMTSPGLGAANVRIEGLSGRYSQVLTDGLPLYGGQAGSTSLLQIPPLDLGRVEVMKGVASALYGASALGGIINFISRRPDGAHELLVNETSQQETDAALWWAGPPSHEGWSYSVLATGSRQTAQDVNDDGWADLPAYRRAVIRPRLYWQDEAGRELYLTAGATLEDRTGGTVAGGRVPSGDPTGTSFLEALKTQRYDAGLTSRIPLAPDRTLTLRASFTDRHLKQTFGDVYDPNRTRTGLAEVDLNGASGAHNWVVGAAFEQDEYRDDTFPAFDFTYHVPGLLAEDDYDVNESVTLSASGRLDVHNQYGTFFSPRLAVLWRPAGRASPWRLRLALGTGFFAPTPITEDTEATGLARILPLEGLHAERARGLSADLDRLWSLPRGALETDVTVFGSSIAHAVNLVEVSAMPPRFAFENDPQPTRTFGTEVLARWRSGPLEIVATHTYVNSTEFQPDEPARMTVPLNPRHAAGFTAAWEPEGAGRVGIEAFYTGRQSLTGTDTPNPYRTMSASYVEFGVLVEHQFGPVNVFLNGENLTDRRMTRFQPLLLPARAPDGRWTTDAWGPLDGRVVNLGMRWRFGESGESDEQHDRD
jgi:outer membrane receptor for ferrienterochelin and colicins